MRTIVVATTLVLLTVPFTAFAFPFGGQASTVVPCYNRAIYANLGAPRGGPYIWTPATQTYQFGPPSFAGQWLLGLASAPYYCIVSIEPVIVWPGTAIDMMGSSGSGGGTIQQLLSTAPPTTATVPTQATVAPASSGTPLVTQPTTIGHVVVSEVYYNVDTAHGSAPANQWIEIFNGSAANADVSGWTIQNSTTQTAIPPNTTLSPAQFLVILANSNTTSYWSIPATAKVVTLGAPIDGGLLINADAVILKNSAGVLVDAVSWGTNTSAFNPPVAASLSGYSLARKGLATDTGTSADWAGSSLPTPGQ